MSQLILRSGRTSPLTIAEVDANFSNLNTDKLEVSQYTGSIILTKLKDVDGVGSGLDADLLDGLNTASTNLPSTVVIRDSSGNFSAGQISASAFIGNLTGNVTGAVTGTATNSTQLGGVAAASYALLASPTLTGTPLAPTAAAGTNTTQIATTAFVRTAITNATASLGTLSTQNSNAVTITGGTMSGVTITVGTGTVGSNSVGNRTISTLAPSGGSNGDIWYRI